MEEAKVNLFAISMAEYQLFRVTVFITRSTSDRWEAVKAKKQFLRQMHTNYSLPHCAKIVHILLVNKKQENFVFFPPNLRVCGGPILIDPHIFCQKIKTLKSFETPSLIYDDKGQGGWLHC